MVTESSYHPKHTVTLSTEKKTVWVNGEVNLLGRFSPQGFEIMRNLVNEPVDALPSSNMLEVKIKNTNSVDWESFKTLMHTHHQIDLSETENPLLKE